MAIIYPGDPLDHLEMQRLTAAIGDLEAQQRGTVDFDCIVRIEAQLETLYGERRIIGDRLYQASRDYRPS